MKMDSFINFIKKIHRHDKNNNYTYLLDNASTHRTKKFIKNVKENKLHVFYNILYHCCWDM